MEKMKLNETVVDVTKTGLSLLAAFGAVGLTMDAIGLLPKQVGLLAKLMRGVTSAAICGLVSENTSAYMERAVDKAADKWNETVSKIEFEDKVKADQQEIAES